jgi:hypothetical protein
VFVRRISSRISIITTHVDDLGLFCNSIPEVKQLKTEIANHVPIKDLGEASQLLGIELIRDRGKRMISLSHRRYIDSKVKKYRLEGSKPVYTPMLDTSRGLSKLDSPNTDAQREFMETKPFSSLVGSLLHPAIMTRPDIRLAVQRVSQFLSNPGKAHWFAAVRILQYLNTTRDLVLTLGGTGTTDLLAYCDADWANSLDHARSISGYALFIGDGCFSWSSKKQTAVALSSTEAEYYAGSHAGRQVVWLRQLLTELNFAPKLPTPLLIDNNSTISIIGTVDQVSNRTKHINIQYHWIREAVQNQVLETRRVDTEDNVSDIFTKPLARPRFEKLRVLLGMGMREDVR